MEFERFLFFFLFLLLCICFFKKSIPLVVSCDIPLFLWVGVYIAERKEEEEESHRIGPRSRNNKEKPPTIWRCFPFSITTSSSSSLLLNLIKLVKATKKREAKKVCWSIPSSFWHTFSDGEKGPFFFSFLCFVQKKEYDGVIIVLGGWKHVVLLYTHTSITTSARKERRGEGKAWNS